MKVLVTGGAGFIGSNLADELVLRGHDVSIVDNLSTGKMENVNGQAKFHKADLRDADQLESVFESEKPEAVFHLAAQINVRSSIKDPIYDASVNVLGSINLLECCRKHGVKKVIYSSSGGAVYGEPKNLPVDETHRIRPMCQYGASKYAVEKYLEVYKSVYGLDSIVLRYGNVYGPRQDPAGEAGVIAIFIDRMISGQEIIINDDGDQTRDFVYVGDVVAANVLALEKDPEEREFNVGNGKPTSVNGIVRSLEKALSVNANPRHMPAISGEVRHIYSDTSRARKSLGFEPAVGLDEGLKRTVEWVKSRKS